ncbi:MAG: TetR family transcriptional regulator [Frankiales bacterium]|nr:TetR family transcriptional regulator [Frankiales bacterium]
MEDEPDDDDPRRRALVEVAAQVLAEDGPHGLSLRKVAAQAGGSTQLVYTLFGGKPGLVDALYSEGFRRLAIAQQRALQAAPPPGDPARILALGHAYRGFAQTEPSFFSVMFGRAVPGFTPARSTRAASRQSTFGVLVQTVRECLDAGTLRAPDAADLARLCWATVHGLTSLEQSGLLGTDDVEAFVAAALCVPVDAHRPPGQPGAGAASL